MADLMDGISRGREPENSGGNNLGTMAIIEAAYRSIRERRPIDIADVREDAKAVSY
jgi:predicted dehydrogenase